MLLSIDRNKIEEELRHTPRGYTIFSLHTETNPISEQSQTISISGTSSDVPFDSKKAHEHLLSLRRRIIESNSPLLDAEAVQREMDEFRGRDSA
jgi:hypothetical protein